MCYVLRFALYLRLIYMNIYIKTYGYMGAGVGVGLSCVHIVRENKCAAGPM